MSQAALHVVAEEPSFNYHLLRAALEKFRLNLTQLDPNQMSKVRELAIRSFEIESMVLASEEATDVFVSDDEIERSLAKIRERYSSQQDMLDDLSRNGLDEQSMREALRRELLFDSVMQRVGSRSVSVNDLDVRLFYEMHRDRFSTPEKRSARHILITVNDDYAENTEQAALKRIGEIAVKLQNKPNRFASMARKHSECPTALEGGKLGVVTRGQLYPELDAMLFEMGEGDVSGVVESEIGLHVLLCERIEPAKQVPLSRAREGIVQMLEQRKRRNCQKAWLGELRRASNAREVS